MVTPHAVGESNVEPKVSSSGNLCTRLLPRRRYDGLQSASAILSNASSLMTMNRLSHEVEASERET
jgi:hypothetical protein